MTNEQTADASSRENDRVPPQTPGPAPTQAWERPPVDDDHDDEESGYGYGV